MVSGRIYDAFLENMDAIFGCTGHFTYMGHLNRRNKKSSFLALLRVRMGKVATVRRKSPQCAGGLPGSGPRRAEYGWPASQTGAARVGAAPRRIQLAGEPDRGCPGTSGGPVSPDRYTQI